MAIKYTTVLKFNEFLQADFSVPEYGTGSTPTLENLGSVGTSLTTFYLDKANIITNSISLYTGSSVEAGATSLLTNGTDYAIVYDKGKITLASDGVASGGLFAAYSYNRYGIKDSLMNDVLERAEAWVEDKIGTVFINNTTASPSVVTNEIHEGQGNFLRVYQTDYYPIYNAQTLASGAISSGASTIVVSSTTGFPSSGFVGVGNDKVTYTGITTTSFTGCSGVSSNHSSGDKVTSFVVERSLTTEGTSPTYDVLAYETDYDVDFQSGEIKLTNSTVVGDISFDSFQAPEKTWNRVRLCYQHGYDSVPTDVEKLVHLVAAKELYSGMVLSSLSRGTNGFTSGIVAEIQDEIDKLIEKYVSIQVKNLN